MSSGNGYPSSSIANIALPPQSRETSAAAAAASAATAAASTAAQTASLAASSATAANGQPSSYDYYSSAEYQQYYQQYYQTQQYAAYYQQQMATATDATAAAAAYQTAALYGQPQMTASYLTAGAYPPLTNSVAAVAAQSTASAATAAENAEEEEDDDDDDDPTIAKNQGPKANTLPYHCNAKMGLNPLIYTNIQQSPYFKNNLFQLKTYLEVIDEIYYNVKHLEPWEKGSRKLSGQTGMCGSVRGVGAGGIISTPFCILYKLYCLRLTRKQVNGLIRHKDSPFIRGLGFMFIRYTQPPQDLWKWFEPYLADDEEVDPKAGGGMPMTMGELVRMLLTKAEWFGTLFPRIPIPVQKEIDEGLLAYDEENPNNPCRGGSSYNGGGGGGKNQRSGGKYSSKYGGHGSRSRSRSRSPVSRHHDTSNKSSRSKNKYDDDRRSNNRSHRSDRY